MAIQGISKFSLRCNAKDNTALESQPHSKGSIAVMTEIDQALHELRLVFTPSGETSFTVRLEDVAGHTVGVPAEFNPFLSDGDLEELRWYLEDYMDLPDGGVSCAQSESKAISRLGVTSSATRFFRARERRCP